MASGARLEATSVALGAFALAMLAACLEIQASSPLLLHQGEWERALRDRDIDPGSIENPVAFDSEMQALAERVATADTARERLRQIQEYLFRGTEFRFSYDTSTTLTAREAFDVRTGNCVSFTNLFIALARSVDIPVQAALVYSHGDPEMDGDLVIINNHIVAAHRRVDSTALFDFNRLAERKLVGFVLIDDLWNTAVYLNNLGTRSLRDGDLEGAGRLIETSLRLAPRFTPAYGNLGVVRRRSGDAAGAWEAYLRGLRIDRHDASIWNNVRRLLEEESVARMEARGWSPARLPETADGMTMRGDLAVVRGDLDGARKLYRRAHRLEPGAPGPYAAGARMQMLRGRWDHAERSLERALDLDPDDAEAARLAEILDRVRGDPRW